MPKRISVTALLAKLSHTWPELASTVRPEILRVYRAQELLYADLARLIEPLGLNPAALDVLAALRSEGPPYELSPTVLYRSLFLSSGGLTKILKRLEVRGLIERQACPKDRRSRLVRLTASGRRVTEDAVEKALAHQEAFVSALSASERKRLDELLDKLLRDKDF